MERLYSGINETKHVFTIIEPTYSSSSSSSLFAYITNLHKICFICFGSTNNKFL